ncbi:MAG: hypothetical protein ACW99Q_05980 [Candidatus Kariarchaeaceae archaeon]
MKNKNLRSFDIRVAKELKSVDKAIVLHTLYYWINKTNNRDNKNRPFVYNPISSDVNNSWQDQFPYYSSKKLIRLFDGLKSDRYVVTMNNNKRRYDKTKSYYLTSKYYKMINGFNKTEDPNQQIDKDKKVSSMSESRLIDKDKRDIPYSHSGQTDMDRTTTPIPNNTTDDTRQIKSTDNTTNAENLSLSRLLDIIGSGGIDISASSSQDEPSSSADCSTSGSAGSGSADSYKDYMFRSLEAEPSAFADLPASPDQFLKWLRDDQRSVSDLVGDLLLSQNRKFCDYYLEQLHIEEQVDFILKINDILDSKVSPNDDPNSYLLPSELFVDALKSKVLNHGQIKRLNHSTFNIAFSKKQKTRKKYLEGLRCKENSIIKQD